MTWRHSSIDLVLALLFVLRYLTLLSISSPSFFSFSIYRTFCSTICPGSACSTSSVRTIQSFLLALSGSRPIRLPSTFRTTWSPSRTHDRLMHNTRYKIHSNQVQEMKLMNILSIRNFLSEENIFLEVNFDLLMPTVHVC